jgi:hypothetical protein
MPKTIAFVLPGRRTLSEHLPAEIIDVPVTIAQRSSSLRKILVRQALTQPSARQIALPDADPVGFRMFVEWLDTGHVEFRPAMYENPRSGILLRDAFSLVFAHIVGSQFEEPDFQDYIIDAIARLLDTSQTPDLKVLEVVFLEKSAPNILKQFVIDRMFAVERKMLSMMRGAAGDQGKTKQNITGCEYHVHEPGECYKTRYLHANAASVTMAARQDVNCGGADRQYDALSTQSSSSSGIFDQLTMADPQHFGSVEWSRQVHGLKRATPTPNPQIDKPLPNVPPLTPGTSPSPSSSSQSSLARFPPASYLDSLCSHPKVDTLGTQDLVSERLGRLPQISQLSAQTRDAPPDLHRASIPGLVLECLERLNKQSLGNTSWPEALSSETSSPADHPLPPWLASQGSNVPPSLVTQPRLHLQPECEELTKLQFLFPKEHHRGLIPFASSPANGFTCMPSHPEILQAVLTSPPLPPLSHSPSLVKRKNVPPRGTDWLKQYDLINSMMNHVPLVPAKRSKKSKFQEMLRSDSSASGA